MRNAARWLAEPLAIAGIALALAWGAAHVVTPVRVAGWSMGPALAPGDVVLIRRGARPIPGDVVLVTADGHEPVLHRVVDLLDSGLARTKGDANQVADLELASPSEVAGTAIAVVPLGEWLARWRGQAAYATMTSQSNSTRR